MVDEVGMKRQVQKGKVLKDNKMLQLGIDKNKDRQTDRVERNIYNTSKRK